jgi:pyruvate formate-lyase activating enzyme-like uncharacterized protein
MIISVGKDSISRVKNVYLLFHMLPGLMITEDFKQVVKNTGVVLDELPYDDEIREKADRLKNKGAHFRNSDKSVYINRISHACSLCDRGTGSITIDISHNCNRRCYHCFGDVSKIPEGHMYDYLGAVDEFSECNEIKSMALSGGEPLLYKSHAINSLGYVYERFPDAYKRMYTNGDFIDAEILKELNDVHLDEIRFSIKHTDFDDWSGLRKKMILSKEYIPNVMVEMPVMPGTIEEMKAILVQLDEIEIFGINLCEFCYCMHHAEEYNKRSYRVKFPPFKILYLSRRQYPGIPVARSDAESYDLLDFSIERGLKMGVHYCSVENRLSSPIYDLNHDQPEDGIGFFSQKDFFIKNAIACGDEDIRGVLRIFNERGIRDYRIMEGPAKYIEFHLKEIELLRGLDLELGIVSSVMEDAPGHGGRGAGGGPGSPWPQVHAKRKRVVKIDLTYPGIFDFADDV